MEFHDIVIQQKSYFDSNSTKSIAFRKIMLKKLMDALDEREDLLLEDHHIAFIKHHHRQDREEQYL